MKKISNKVLQLIKDNKNIAIILIIAFLIVSISIAVTYSYYSVTNTRNLISGKIGDITLPDLTIQYMIENRNDEGDGAGTYFSSYKAPTNGYVFIPETSSCTNEASFVKNEDNTFTINSKGKTKCNFYFNAVNINSTEDISLVFMKERKKVDGKGAGVYETVTEASIASLLLQGYAYNSSLSKCSDNSAITYNFFEKTINVDATKPKLTCTIYFKVAAKATVGFVIDHGTMSDYMHEVDFNGSLTTSYNLESGYLASNARLICDNGIVGSLSETTINLTNVPKTGVCRIVYITQLLAYTGSVQNYTIPETGTYKLQVWGAEGGNAGGKGGYSEGNIYLTKGTKIFIHVGEAGSKSGNSLCAGGGYNGGGCAFNTGGGGGGATDIRIGTNNLNYRVIVAGGGGGKGADSCAIGGAGGGVSGIGNTTQGSCGTQGGAGKILAGGEAGIYLTNTGNVGTFGNGGAGKNDTLDGGGGGGGWFGGGSGASGLWSSGAGGGSGFIYTETHANSNLSSNYYLENAATYAGDVTFSSITGGTETGHSGNGYAIISLVN